MAGESAQDLARRQRERAERLLRSAERYEQGAHGERATGAILDELRQHGWAVFHDVRWPGRPRANIDHVAVGPSGVFVIDSKNWSGRIDVVDQTFRRNGRRQDKVVAAAGDAALAVAALVGPEACASTRSVLCFVRDEPLFGWCHDVMVCSTGNLREILLTRTAVLTVDQVRTTGLGLHLGFQANVPTPGSRAPRPVVSGLVRQMAAPRAPHARKRASIAGPLIRLGLFLVLALVFISQLPRLGAFVGEQVTNSLTHQEATEYRNCAALRKDFPHGVGARAAVRQAAAKNGPAVEPKVYRANAALDVDDDGLACEPRARRN